MTSSLQAVSLAFVFLFCFSFVAAIGIDNPNLPIVKPDASGNITNYNNYTTNNYTINGSALELDDISDVDASSPTNGYALIWNSTLSKWIAGAVSTASSWVFNTDNGYLTETGNEIGFNDTKLNATILELAPTANSSNIYKIYFNHSNKNIITYNLSDSDAEIIEVYTVDGQKEIFGGEFV